MTTSPMHTQSGVDANSNSAKAQRAVKVFRSMQPGLTSFAKVLTGDRKVRVELAAGGPRTDGTKIYYRPPIALGSGVRHDRAACDRRDPGTGLQLCAACAVREEVMIQIYHEISHIAFGSFNSTTEADKTELVDRALKEYPGRFADQVRARIASTPAIYKESYMGLAGLVSDYLPHLLNALEDVRIDNAMFRARRGTKAMFDAMTTQIFITGIETDVPGEFVMWDEQPLNAQIVVGVFCLGSEYDYTGWFSPSVETALGDQKLRTLVVDAITSGDNGEVYRRCFPILARLRELGFLKNEFEDDDEDDDTDPDADDSADDSSSDAGDSEDSMDEPEDQGSSSDSPDTEEVDDEDDTSGSDDSSSDTGDADGSDVQPEPGEGEEDQDSPGDDGDSSDSSENQGESSAPEDDSPTGDDAPSGDSDGADEGAPQDADAQDGTASQDDEAGTGGDASEQPEDEGSASGGSPDDPASDAGAGGEGQGSSGSDQDGGTSDGGSGQHDPEGDDGGELGSSVRDQGPVDGKDSGGDGDRDGERDAAGDDSSDSGSDVHDRGEDAQSGESSEHSDSSDRAAEPPTSSGNSDASADAATEDDAREGDDATDVVDTGADEGKGGVETKTEPGHGSATDLNGKIEVFTHHGEIRVLEEDIENESDGSDKSAVAQAENSAMDIAIIQGLYFEQPSANIGDVKIWRMGDSCDDDPYFAWQYAPQYRSDLTAEQKSQLTRMGQITSLEIPESVMGPATLQTRRTFDDNQRASREKNMKSGKVRANALGKRAWSGDERLFGKRTLPGKKSYSVIIGVDISGSTMGENLVLAKKAAFAQAELCQRVGIDFAVYAHTTGHSYEWAQQYPEYDYRMDMYEIKAFDSEWTSAAKSALADINSAAGNLDGHSMEFYRKLVERRNTTDKIIMYYTDGKMPAANHDEELEIMQREIKYCTQHGITLMGVGIRTDSPKRHGLDTVQIDTEQDLGAVVKHLGKRIQMAR